MHDLHPIFQHNYLTYASYVILDRAIPHAVDGLKPVQRRILWTLHLMDDHKLHKVANVAGQTMALHPHGDAPIMEALVNLANKGYLLEMQGNFGNPLTGDPPAAGRYIETKLSALAQEALFNIQLTTLVDSYDGRKKEPVTLPSKIPLLLLHGAEGIAVGMVTKILPHNFQEVLTAQIALLKGKSIPLFPDFPSGGSMDSSDYRDGMGSVMVRATIEIHQPRKLVIREVCFGSTTESTIQSIEEAAKQGKLKIEEIHDYTAEQISIEIALPKGADPQESIDALYAYTECATTLHPKMLAIKDNKPQTMTVTELLTYHVERLQHYLKEESLFEYREIQHMIFKKTLERLFITQKMYSCLEHLGSLTEIYQTLDTLFLPFHSLLSTIPTHHDFEQLLLIPIRRISQFDLHHNEKDIASLQKQMKVLEKRLNHFTAFVIDYLKQLLNKYGPLFPRKTQLKTFTHRTPPPYRGPSHAIGYNASTGYLGYKVQGSHVLECVAQDLLLLCFSTGVYEITPPPEKRWIHAHGILSSCSLVQKDHPLSVIYYDPQTETVWGKKCRIPSTQKKLYRFIPEGTTVLYTSTKPKGKLKLSCYTKERKKGRSVLVSLDDLPIKTAAAKGIKIVNREMNHVSIV